MEKKIKGPSIYVCTCICNAMHRGIIYITLHQTVQEMHTALRGLSFAVCVFLSHWDFRCAGEHSENARAQTNTAAFFITHATIRFLALESMRQQSAREKEREMKRKQCTQFDNGEKKKKIVNTTMRRNSIPKFSLQTFSVFSVFSVTSLLWCICCSDAWTEKKICMHQHVLCMTCLISPYGSTTPSIHIFFYSSA